MLMQKLILKMGCWAGLIIKVLIKERVLTLEIGNLLKGMLSSKKTSKAWTYYMK
jgi:hypothetical protein